MKKSIYLFIAIQLVAGILFAQVPQTMSFQGILKNNDGRVVNDGEYEFTFKLYEQEQGGSAVWTETQTDSVIGGVLNIILGNATPLSIDFANPYWLGISINGGVELSPRSQLTSSAYSMIAKDVENGAVVKSINNLKDDVVLEAGSNVSIDKNGNTLTISTSGSGTGNGTQGFIPKFVDDKNLGDSKLYQVDNMVGIQSSIHANEIKAKFQVNKTNYILGDTVDYLALFQTTPPVMPPTFTQQAYITKIGEGYFRSNLGIGTKSPSEMLDVNGNAHIGGMVHSSVGGFKFPDGSIQATAASKNTLDKAYDEGGPGAGRTITADAGAVNIAGSGGLSVDGNVLANGNLEFTHSKIINKEGRLEIAPANNRMIMWDGKGSMSFEVYHGSNDLDVRLKAGGENSWIGAVNKGRLGVGTQSPRELLDVNGNAHVRGRLTVGECNVSLPIAYGVVKSGKKVSGTSNFTVDNHPFNNGILITFDGITYDDNYITTVTIMQAGASTIDNYTPIAYPESGKLKVLLNSSTGYDDSIDFQFVTYSAK